MELGIEKLTIHRQFKAPPTRGHQRVVFDRLLEAREQLGGQTDRLWLIVSHCAIFEANVHGKTPVLKECSRKNFTKVREGDSTPIHPMILV